MKKKETPTMKKIEVEKSPAIKEIVSFDYDIGEKDDKTKIRGNDSKNELKTDILKEELIKGKNIKIE